MICFCKSLIDKLHLSSFIKKETILKALRIHAGGNLRLSKIARYSIFFSIEMLFFSNLPHRITYTCNTNFGERS